MPREIIRIGTDCSGMEAPVQAIRNLKVAYAHKFSCDINPHARETIKANFPEGIMYEDVTTRDNKTAPAVDLYVAGFPCQPFSTMGVQRGFNDRKGRGKIFFYVLDYIVKQKPRVFILENVSGLTRGKMIKYKDAILEELRSLNLYNIQDKVLDTKQHGVPHSRKRWYCVGILKSVDDGSFCFPEPLPLHKRPKIEDFLERRKAALAETGLPPESSSTARANVKNVLRTLKREGSDPTKKPFIVDCDSTAARMSTAYGVSPCITCGRGAGHWVTNRGRRLTKEEMMRLQGMDPTQFKVAISEAQLGKQLGNTMSVNVLERLLIQVLPAAQLAPHGVLPDRWANGQAVRKLLKTRGLGFKSVGLKRKASDSSGSEEKRARGA